MGTIRSVGGVLAAGVCIAACRVSAGTHPFVEGDAASPDDVAPAPIAMPPPDASRLPTHVTAVQGLGATVRADVPPPAISGGTLIVLRNGLTAVAADPDRDCVWFVDLDARHAIAQVMLAHGDEPGRLAEDTAGRVHVVLRRSGDVVSIDPMAHAVTSRRSVCGAPRGIAYDGTNDVLRIACAGGEFVSLPAGGGAAMSQTQLPDDLRDVVLDRGRVFVSRFRSAELLQVAADGSMTRTVPPPIEATAIRLPDNRIPIAEPGVAWRTIALPTGGVLMLHQRALAVAVRTTPGGYGQAGATSTGLVSAAMSVFDEVTAPAIASPPIPGLVLAVDIAVRDDGRIAIVAPGSATSAQGAQLIVSDLETLRTAPPSMPVTPMSYPSGQATAVAFDRIGRLVIQNREPAAIDIVDAHGDTHETVILPGDSREDTGHRLFHMNAGASMLACASCHPEGGDDGRVWTFDALGPRRTQSLRGGVIARAPFHWDGDQHDFAALVDNVFTRRMGGGLVSAVQRAALSDWLDAQPSLRSTSPVDGAAVERGRQLFNAPEVGCASCHSGPELTNHGIVDVGTGQRFKVPSLVGLRWHAPYLHNGCAATLRDRFGACGGTAHGATANLAASQIDDLVAYLGTL